MKKGNIGIGLKISSVMMVSIGLLLAALCLVLVVQINKVLLPLNQSYSNEIVKARKAEIEQWIGGKITLLKSLGENKVYRSGDMEAIVREMDDIKKIPDPDFQELVYAGADGNTYSNKKTMVNVLDREYFQETVQGNNDWYISNAIVSRADGSSIVIIAHAVFDSSGRKNGLLFATITMEHLSEITGAITLGEAGYAWITDGTGLIIAHPVDEYLNTLKMDELEEKGYRNTAPVVKDLAAGQEGVRWVVNSAGDDMLWIYKPVDMTSNWSLGVVVPKDQINEAAVMLVTVVIAASLVILFVTGIIAVMFARSISNPLLRITDTASKLAVGNLEVEKDKAAKDQLRRDEIGTMSRAFMQLLDYTTEKVRVSEKIASGNLDVEVNVSSEKDQLGTALKGMVGSLNDLLHQVNESIDQVNSGADQVAQASQSLSQGASEQASSLEEISASITQINGQSVTNAESALEAKGIARQASEDAGKGNTQMAALTEAMNRINESSDQIKKIVKVIDDIAFQTNLLALNANVEAARAGKYGKGFAVVADEVRNLAVRSAEAVKETSSMVDDSIKNIEEGNEVTKLTAEQLESIMEGSAKVADFLEEIAAASKEQAEGINQITQGIDQIEQVTQSNTASAEESAAASEELASQSVNLKHMISRFKLKGKTVSGRIKQLGYTGEEQPSVHMDRGYSNDDMAGHDDYDFDRF